jgi:hypothetical protein
MVGKMLKIKDKGCVQTYFPQFGRKELKSAVSQIALMGSQDNFIWYSDDDCVSSTDDDDNDDDADNDDKSNGE